MENRNAFYIRIAAVLCLLAVILGAMGAHALKPLLSPESLQSFETAVRYHFFHALALLLLVSLGDQLDEKRMKLAAQFFLLGIGLFSGSIYLLSTQAITGLQVKFLGPITPLGGLSLMTGWVFLFLATKKK